MLEASSTAPTYVLNIRLKSRGSNINTASAQQLTTLPGVGEKLAARIIEHRQKSGAFRTAQELMNVKGIGERNFLKIQPHILVGDAPARAAAAK
jgi:competence protein ComEA